MTEWQTFLLSVSVGTHYLCVPGKLGYIPTDTLY